MTPSHPGDAAGPGGFDPTVIEPLLKGRRLTKPLIAAVERARPSRAAPRSFRPPTSGWRARARGSASPRRAGGCSRSGGSTVRLVRQIPYTVAADPLLTGRHITAAQALEIGLIGHVVPDGQALAKALEIAEAIAANGPVAVRAILRTIRETEGMAEADAFKIEAQIGPWRCSAARTPRRARAPSPRSASPSSATADPPLSHRAACPGLLRARGRQRPGQDPIW